MEYLDVIKHYGKLTKAQQNASHFYLVCEQSNKSINFEAATASVYLDALTNHEMKILKGIGIKPKDIAIYPHGRQIEVWFI